MQFFLVVFLFLNFIPKVENRRCSSVNGEECCTGYALNKITGECEKCPPGYFDKCSKQCIKPYYGENCQSKCHCTDGYYCHFANGCLSTKGNDTQKQEPSSTRLVLQTSSAVSFLYSVWDRSTTTSVQTISKEMFGNISNFNKPSVKRDGDDIKTDYIFLVIVVLIGIFVLFFSLFVVTYIYFKCFRKHAINVGIKDNTWQVQYTSLHVEATEPQPQEQQVNVEHRGRVNLDPSYLSPVFVRNESISEPDGVFNNDNRLVNREMLLESGKNRQDMSSQEMESIVPLDDLTDHVYFEVNEDNGD